MVCYPINRTREVAFPAWGARAAGMGLLGKITWRPKAVACIEDTAVDIEDLVLITIDEVWWDGWRALIKAGSTMRMPVAGEISSSSNFRLKSSRCGGVFIKFLPKASSPNWLKNIKDRFHVSNGDGRVRAGFYPFEVGEKITYFSAGSNNNTGSE